MTLLEFVCEHLMGPPVSRSNGSSMWHCPKHEDNHPSFHTLPHKPAYKDRFKCWSCDFWGDVFDLLREFFPDENFSQHQLRLAFMRQDFERDTKPKVIRTRPNISFSLRGRVSDASTNQKVFALFGVSFNLSGNEAHCKNANAIIRWVHKTCLEATRDEDYQRLKDERGLSLLTLKRHELAWYAANGCWLIPFKSESGKFLNLLRYYPEDGKKFFLPGLQQRLYGLHELQPDSSRTLLVCEGPFDAIALDRHLRQKKTRKRYDILAAPSATTFRREWLKYLKGRTVRLLFDNDKAGRDGQDRIAKFCRDGKVDCRLSVLKWPSGYPEKCDIGDLVRDGVDVMEFAEKYVVRVSSFLKKRRACGRATVS